MNYYTEAFKKYAIFKGRATRAEYWYFVLFNIIISIAISIVERRSDGMLSSLYSLIVLVPSISVGVRRMHDINKSGWFFIIPIYNLFLLAQKGDESTNKYGEKPQNA